MKNIKEKLKNINLYHFILYLIIFILIVIIILMYFFYEPNDKVIYTDNINIKEILDKKEEIVIYVYSSDKEECKYCSNVKDFLKSEKIKYLAYDVKKASNDNYKELLSGLEIDKKIFNYPALIYIKDGKMFANVINIDDTKLVEQFIKNYNLSLL